MRILFLFFFGISSMAFSQPLTQVDSLKTLATKQSLSEQMNTYYTIANLLLDINPEESLFYGKKSLGIALQTNDNVGITRAYSKIGWSFLQMSSYDSAAFYLLKATNIGKATRDKFSLLNAMIALSNAYDKQMKYDSAISTLNEALAIAENINSDAHLAAIYAGLGNTYSMCNQSDTAIALYFKAKDFYKESGNKRDLAVMLNNIARLLLQVEKYESALELLTQATEINTEINNIVGKVSTINNAAICYKELGLMEKAISSLNENIELTRNNNLTSDLAINYSTMANTLNKMGHYDEARLYFDSSLYICKTSGIGYGILINTIDLGYMYQHTKQCDSSLVYFSKALNLINNYDMNYEKSHILAGIYHCYKEYGIFDSALFYFEQYKIVFDSLHKVDINNKLTELEGKYQQEKNQAEIASLNENIYRAKSAHRLNIIIISSTFFLILLYALVRRYQLRTKLLQAQIIKKEKINLEMELETRQKELAVKAMHNAHLNEQTLDLSLKLRDVSRHASSSIKEKIINLINDLDKASPKDAWKEFETRFEHVHQDFYHALNQLYPELTPNEIKICSFIRLNMSSKDIALLTNRSIRTIESTRNNIRKKLQIEHGDSLAKFLLSL